MPHGTVKVPVDCFMEYLNCRAKTAIPVGQRDPDNIKATVPLLSFWQAHSEDWRYIVGGSASQHTNHQFTNENERKTKEFIIQQLNRWFGTSWTPTMTQVRAFRRLDGTTGPPPRLPSSIYHDTIDSMADWYETFGATLDRIGAPKPTGTPAPDSDSEDDSSDSGSEVEDEEEEEDQDGELWNSSDDN